MALEVDMYSYSTFTDATLLRVTTAFMSQAAHDDISQLCSDSHERDYYHVEAGWSGELQLNTRSSSSPIWRFIYFVNDKEFTQVIAVTSLIISA